MSDDKPITIGKFFSEVLEDVDCRVLKFAPFEIWGKTKTKPARVKIALTDEICGIDIRDLRKWNLFIVAVPVEGE